MSGFIFAEDYEFDWPVTVRYPSAQGEEERRFMARLRMPEEDELFQAAPEGLASYAEQIAADRARIESLVVGWSGIALEGGGELPFSPGNLAKLLRQRPVRLALGEAIFEALVKGEQRAKN